MPEPKFVFAVLGPLFLLLAAWSGLQGRGGPGVGSGPRTRTWLLIGVIFCAVAAWLWAPALRAPGG